MHGGRGSAAAKFQLSKSSGCGHPVHRENTIARRSWVESEICKGWTR